ncbi:MAG: DNA-processing protein DprA [Candidatus Omnitrophica bacterium]|nr:DNA-processing protein DprA [Candidatus Omnitrophota bacterium]
MILTHDERRALVCLNRAATGKTAREALALFQQGLKPREVCEQLMAAGTIAAEKLFPAETEFHPDREVEAAQTAGIQILSWFDAAYPDRLRAIENAPLVLYVRGTLSAQDAAAVAVVGSREPSFYGSAQAARLSRELAAAGVTVVSGLARGIDEAAHQGCLAVPYGRTLAVLGCGPDKIYPRENQKLADAIAERGAVISEFPLGTEPLSWNFPRRNRIISGLSHGVLVVEAHVRSGSLITARLAAEQGRQVFAVPGPVDQWTSRGAHQLLREGAVLVENAKDILEDLAPLFKTLMTPPRTETAEKNDAPEAAETPMAADFLESKPSSLDDFLMNLLRQGPRTADEILQTGEGQAVREVLSALSQLELVGQIKKASNGQFSILSGV